MNSWLLISSFLAVLFPTLLSPLFFPFLKLNFFAPFLVMLLYKKTKIETLWYALLVGFILDLLSANTPFGFWSFNYLVTLFTLSYLKQIFFEDKFMTLPLLTLFFSIISTLLFAVSTHLFFHKIHFAFSWILTDFFFYPLFDSVYALITFSVPLFYLSKYLPQKRRAVQSFRMTKD